MLPCLALTYCFDFSERVNIMSFLYIYLTPSLLQMVPLLLYSHTLPKVIPAAYSSVAFEVLASVSPLSHLRSTAIWNLHTSTLKVHLYNQLFGCFDKLA